MSATRRVYFIHLAGRCLILSLCILFYLFWRDVFLVLEGLNFFKTLSPLHLLWFIWAADMLLQLLPIRGRIALGSQKLFAFSFRPAQEKTDHEGLRNYVISSTKAAYKVFLLWALLTAAIGAASFAGFLGAAELLLFSAAFYVCDLICVLIWCPFRLILKTRCCTTCRIFNWDHLMMFSPLIFAGGFFAFSLVLLAAAAWLAWELSFMMYPERFWERTNAALRCQECTDKLCRRPRG